MLLPTSRLPVTEKASLTTKLSAAGCLPCQMLSHAHSNHVWQDPKLLRGVRGSKAVVDWRSIDGFSAAEACLFPLPFLPFLLPYLVFYFKRP